MAYYTPLRYPGGKRRLASTVSRLLDHNGIADVEYVEPFAGGAAVALALLFEGKASKVHLNDLSRPVYAFWHSVLYHPKRLCRRIQAITVSMRVWRRQRATFDTAESADLEDLGLAAFFLNRTNRSGIIRGGVIGGKQQAGDWSLDARFNKRELISRIRAIAERSSAIQLYQQDSLDFTTSTIPKLTNAFVFFDPPYIDNGEALYLNEYTVAGHKDLARAIQRVKHPWIVTYDYGAVAHGLFKSRRRLVYDLHYTAQGRHRGREVMFLSDGLSVPSMGSLFGRRMRAVNSLSRVRTRRQQLALMG